MEKCGCKRRSSKERSENHKKVNEAREGIERVKRKGRRTYQLREIE